MDREESPPIEYRAFWIGILCLIFLLPLVFSTSFYRSFETVKSSLLRVGVSFLLLGWSIIQWKEKGFYFFSFSSITRAVLLFLLSFFISSLLSIEPTLSIFGTYDRQLGLIDILAVSCFYLLLVEGFRMGGKGSSIIKVMALSGSFSSLYSLFQFFGLDPIAWSKAFGNRPSSTLGHPDFLGELLAMTIPLSLSLCYEGKGWGQKGAWFLSALIQLGGLIVSQTRGAWIAGTVSISTFFLLAPFFYQKSTKLLRTKLMISLLAFFLFLGLGVCSLVLKPEFRYRAASILKLKEQARFFLWRDSLKVIKEYPLFGSGPETFRISFMPYKGIELARMEKNLNYDNPHNNYLFLWATAGTLGFVAYLYMLLCCFKEGLRKIKNNNHLNSPIFYLGILTSLEAYCVSMVTGFDTISTVFYFYVIIAILAGGKRPLKTKEQSAGTASKKYTMLIILICLSCLTFYDVSRALMADHLTLKALKLLGKKPPCISKACQNLRHSCALLPRESFYRLQLGMIYLKIGQKEVEKKDSLHEAVHWGYLSLLHGWAPENSYNLIGTAYLYLRDCRSAEWACKQGLEVDPHNYPLRTNLAISLSCQGKTREALNEVVKALSIDPDYPFARKLKKWLTAKSRLPEASQP